MARQQLLNKEETILLHKLYIRYGVEVVKKTALILNIEPTKIYYYFKKYNLSNLQDKKYNAIKKDPQKIKEIFKFYVKNGMGKTEMKYGLGHTFILNIFKNQGLIAISLKDNRDFRLQGNTITLETLNQYFLAYKYWLRTKNILPIAKYYKTCTNTIKNRFKKLNFPMPQELKQYPILKEKLATFYITDYSKDDLDYFKSLIKNKGLNHVSKLSFIDKEELINHFTSEG